MAVRASRLFIPVCQIRDPIASVVTRQLVMIPQSGKRGLCRKSTLWKIVGLKHELIRGSIRGKILVGFDGGLMLVHGRRHDSDCRKLMI